MAENIQFTFELSEHPEKMSAEDISDILLGTTSALKYISQEISKSGDGVFDWQILNIGMNKPFHAIFSPSDTCPIEIASKAERKFFQGQKLLSQKKELPESFNRDAIESLYRVYSARKRTGKLSRFINKSYEIKSNVDLEKNLEDLLQSLTKYEHFEWTTLTGKLQEVGGKPQISKNPYFNLKTNIFGTTVKCYFCDEKFREFRDYLELNPLEISVFGKVKFNDKGQPVDISEIQSYKIIPKIDSLIKSRSDIDINLTNGIDSVDYINQVRHK